MLPLAAGGVDIDEVLCGYRAAKGRYDNPNLFTNDVMKYAAARFILMLKGKSVEVLANYEPALTQFGEWYKQLMAESEGKDNEGLFPTPLS